jgi:hypothetical protein
MLVVTAYKTLEGLGVLGERAGPEFARGEGPAWNRA